MVAFAPRGLRLESKSDLFLVSMKLIFIQEQLICRILICPLALVGLISKA